MALIYIFQILDMEHVSKHSNLMNMVKRHLILMKFMNDKLPLHVNVNQIIIFFNQMLLKILICFLATNIILFDDMILKLALAHIQNA